MSLINRGTCRENKTCNCDIFYSGDACEVYEGCPQGVSKEICDAIISSHAIDKTEYSPPPVVNDPSDEILISDDLLTYTLIIMVIVLILGIVGSLFYCCCCRINGSQGGFSQPQTLQTLPTAQSLGQINGTFAQQSRQIPQRMSIQKHPSVISNGRILVSQ